ncbi:MAG: hypothetical protein IKE29_13405 [Paenibacillus sp.]|uniref:hypothetical protein n=1 Tax=Paenibacillus sp. TaxID=58172 RepID=UPI0025EABA73|nr:hypothetical protein [Paenibacillus sp.]MBR2565606.1 hypothetical protein [Paenibacillus sp.]
MSTVTFWSPFSEMGCSSSALIGAYAMAIQYRTRVLLVNTGLANSGIEAGLHREEKVSNDVVYSFEENGWDAVERLFLSGSLSKHNLRDYTKPLMKDRLDLLTGSMNRGERTTNENRRLLKTLLEAANQCYDLVLLDAGSTSVDSLYMVQHSDYVVVVLNQDMRHLDMFFKQILPEQLSENKLHILINKYDSHSRASLSNIKRSFRYKESLSAIPYQTGFLDAMNRRDVARYLQLENWSEKKDVRKGSFSDGMSELARLVMDGAGMRTVLKRLERGA